MGKKAQPVILIVEDDEDQMVLLVELARAAISNLVNRNLTTDEQKRNLRSAGIAKVTNYESLSKAVKQFDNIILAIVDCNIPDKEGGKAHDQLVKTNHRITGQHRSVDLLIAKLPLTPITMTSSMDRFKSIVAKFYEVEKGLSINFIRKTDQTVLQKNISYYLRQTFFNNTSK